MKKVWNVVRWILLISIILGVVGVATIWGIDYYVESTGKQKMTAQADAPESDAILVLGAYVTPDGQVSEMLRDRLDMGYALYIAEQMGLDATGVGADTYEYPGTRYYRLREYPARVKAFLQAQIFRPEPKFLGDPIPVWGDGIVTGDGKE